MSQKRRTRRRVQTQGDVNPSPRRWARPRGVQGWIDRHLYGLPDKPEGWLPQVVTMSGASATEAVREEREAEAAAKTVEVEAIYYPHEIEDIKEELVDITPENIFWAYLHDEAAQTMVITVTQTVIGDGPIIRGDEAADASGATELINQWNQDVDAARRSIEDIIFEAVEDCYVNPKAFGVFAKDIKVLKTEKTGDQEVPKETKVNLKHLDFREITESIHPFTGWRKWVQEAKIDSSMPGIVEVKADDGSVSYMPVADAEKLADAQKEFEKEYDPTKQSEATHKVHLNEKQVIYFKFFARSPLASVLDIMLDKKRLQVYKRRAAKKFGYGGMKIKVGTADPGGHPTNIEEYNEMITEAAKSGAKWVNEDVWSYPYNWEVSQMDMPSFHGLDFDKLIEACNAAIIMAMLSSINLFRAQFATYRPEAVEQNWLRFITFVRTRIGNVLDKFYADILALKKETGEIEPGEKEADEGGKYESVGKVWVEWPELRPVDRQAFMSMVVDLYASGILKDINEARELLEKAGIELPALKEEEVEVMEEKETEKAVAVEAERRRFLSAATMPEHRPVKMKRQARILEKALTRYQKEVRRRLKRGEKLSEILPEVLEKAKPHFNRMHRVTVEEARKWTARRMGIPLKEMVLSPEAKKRLEKQRDMGLEDFRDILWDLPKTLRLEEELAGAGS